MTKENIELVESALLKRRSVRHFKSDKIPSEDLLRLIKSGVYAPSGSNWQNQRFLVIDNKDELMRVGESRFVWPYKGANQERVKKANPGGIIGNAAAAIVVFSDSLKNDRRGNGEYHVWENLETQNCSASIQNILTLATAMGIGNCWISASDKMNFTRLFSGQTWRKLLANYEIPNYYKLQGIVILGYPRSVDDEGYPVGEKKHGATIWQTTERMPTEEYLIRKVEGNACATVKVARGDALKIKVMSKLIRFAHRVIKWSDKRIHRIEIGKYLKP